MTRHPARPALLKLVRRLFADRSGNVALIFGLAIIPLFGFGGAAVDYSRAANLRAALQLGSDEAALVVAQAGTSGGQAFVDKALADVRGRVQAAFGADVASQLELDGRWLSPTDFQVTAHTALGTTMLKAVPGMPKQLAVSVETIARLAEATMTMVPPKLVHLDPEAGDYNRIYVYCFDGRALDNDKRRTQMTPIADNAGTSYSFDMPACKKGETVSYRLYNVRDARLNPRVWDSGMAERYDYFTDTTISGLVHQHNFADNLPILETAVCSKLKDCKPKGAGGDIPEGRNRSPQTTAQSCEAGKFMYFGWEDRPPGRGWTDRDYDDIRFVVECPKVTADAARNVRLIK